MKRLLLTALIFLPLHPLSPALKPLLVVWNIGQGQWITVVTESACHHFDMGGERAPPLPVLHWCRQRANDLYVSHGDLDHIKFIPWGERNLPGLCMAAPPLDKISQRKKAMLALVPACPQRRTVDIEIRELTHFDKKDADRPGEHNELSRVFLVKTPDGSVLIPGDSTTEAEDQWLKNLRGPDRVQILILGHHGSRTSTGEPLLRALPDLRETIASARRARYGHPHPEVVFRLLVRGISVMTTEKSGHTAFRL